MSNSIFDLFLEGITWFFVSVHHVGLSSDSLTMSNVWVYVFIFDLFQ
jgi:hypothetical protein